MTNFTHRLGKSFYYLEVWFIHKVLVQMKLCIGYCLYVGNSQVKFLTRKEHGIFFYNLAVYNMIHLLLNWLEFCYCVLDTKDKANIWENLQFFLSIHNCFSNNFACQKLLLLKYLKSCIVFAQFDDRSLNWIKASQETDAGDRKNA